MYLSKYPKQPIDESELLSSKLDQQMKDMHCKNYYFEYCQFLKWKKKTLFL